MTEEQLMQPCGSRFDCTTPVQKKRGSKPLSCDACRALSRRLHIEKWNRKRRSVSETVVPVDAAPTPEPPPPAPAPVASYWSEDEGRFIECEVAWAGKGAMPHQDRVEPAWSKHRDLVLEHAPSSAQLLTKRDKQAIHRNGTPAQSGPWSKSPMHQIARDLAGFPDPIKVRVRGRCRNCGRMRQINGRRMCGVCCPVVNSRHVKRQAA